MEIGTWKHRVGEVHFPAVVSFYTSIHRPNRLLFFSLLLVPFSPLLSVRFSFSTLSGAINKSWTNFIFKVSIINFFEFLNYRLVTFVLFYVLYFIRGNFRTAFYSFERFEMKYYFPSLPCKSTFHSF